jgi:hypothetical protein
MSWNQTPPGALPAETPPPLVRTGFTQGMIPRLCSAVFSLVYGRVAASLNGDEWALQARDDGSRSTDAIR